MSLPSFCNQVITRIRPGIKIERGSEIPDWENATSQVISGVSIQPAESNISLDGRVLGLKNVYKVYCNPYIDIKAGDHIIFDNETFVVDEAPRKWQSPTNRVSNMQFTMAHWEG